MILDQIESAREELYKMIHHHENEMSHKQIIEMSQYLDKLLVEYERCAKGEESNEER
ncbi:MAG TPA: aspartyl-phosphate phosphatase Spo0E family protein [Clostridiales bacterium]|nr:aspartyl-phosphate phosphatase Spo0E family protein [Clostridiales bacterium]